MRLKYFSLCLLFFFSLNIISQEMKEGFKYLETGKYKKAAFFFNQILKTYPKNKTARLCYGRAVGLLGKSEKSIQLFTRLLQDYPSDFEVKLNYAEALLWNTNFLKAKKYYEKLIKENSTSFSALLGYA
ncbi:MAG: tetratricopeptide (TPR) repeat protein, partial [Psychroserpens sp.]